MRANRFQSDVKQCSRGARGVPMSFVLSLGIWPFSRQLVGRFFHTTSTSAVYLSYNRAMCLIPSEGLFIRQHGLLYNLGKLYYWYGVVQMKLCVENALTLYHYLSITISWYVSWYSLFGIHSHAAVFQCFVSAYYEQDFFSSLIYTDKWHRSWFYLWKPLLFNGGESVVKWHVNFPGHTLSWVNLGTTWVQQVIYMQPYLDAH